MKTKFYRVSYDTSIQSQHVVFVQANSDTEAEKLATKYGNIWNRGQHKKAMSELEPGEKYAYAANRDSESLEEILAGSGFDEYIIFKNGKIAKPNQVAAASRAYKKAQPNQLDVFFEPEKNSAISKLKKLGGITEDQPTTSTAWLRSPEDRSKYGGKKLKGIKKKAPGVKSRLKEAGLSDSDIDDYAWWYLAHEPVRGSKGYKLLQKKLSPQDFKTVQGAAQEFTNSGTVPGDRKYKGEHDDSIKRVSKMLGLKETHIQEFDATQFALGSVVGNAMAAYLIIRYGDDTERFMNRIFDAIVKSPLTKKLQQLNTIKHLTPKDLNKNLSSNEKKHLDKIVKSVDEGTGTESSDWDPELIQMAKQYDRNEINMGLKAEQEHNQDPATAVADDKNDLLKIVLAHMEEDEQYYTNLAQMEEALRQEVRRILGLSEAKDHLGKELDRLIKKKVLKSGDAAHISQNIWSVDPRNLKQMTAFLNPPGEKAFPFDAVQDLFAAYKRDEKAAMKRDKQFEAPRMPPTKGAISRANMKTKQNQKQSAKSVTKDDIAALKKVGMKISSVKGSPLSDAAWLKGTWKNNDIEMLIFNVPSKFGISKGRISKFYMKDENPQKSLVATAWYDRGWDTKPSDSAVKKFVDSIVKAIG